MMKCDDVRKQIDLGIAKSSVNIDPEISSHIKSCGECESYYKEIVKLINLLNSQTFEVLPGELDHITFENIARSPVEATKRAEIFKSIFSWRWAWVPAAAAAIAILFLILPNSNNIEDEQISVVQSDSTYLGDGIFVENENEASALLASLVSEESEIDMLAGELIYDSEIKDLIATLTDDEYELLFESLENTNGGSG